MADGAPDPILQLILTRSDVLELVQVVNSTAFADELAQATAELLTLWPPNHTVRVSVWCVGRQCPVPCPSALAYRCNARAQGPLPPQHELLLHGFLVRVQRALDLSTDPGAEAHLRYMMWPLHRVVEPGCGAPLVGGERAESQGSPAQPAIRVALVPCPASHRRACLPARADA